MTVVLKKTRNSENASFVEWLRRITLTDIDSFYDCSSSIRHADEPAKITSTWLNGGMWSNYFQSNNRCRPFNRGVLKGFCEPLFPCRVSRCSNKPWEPEWWHDRKNGLRTERLADSRWRIASIYTVHWEDSNRENQAGKLEGTCVTSSDNILSLYK